MKTYEPVIVAALLAATVTATSYGGISGGGAPLVSGISGVVLLLVKGAGRRRRRGQGEGEAQRAVAGNVRERTEDADRGEAAELARKPPNSAQVLDGRGHDVDA